MDLRHRRRRAIRNHPHMLPERLHPGNMDNHSKAIADPRLPRHKLSHMELLGHSILRSKPLKYIPLPTCPHLFANDLQSRFLRIILNVV